MKEIYQKIISDYKLQNTSEYNNTSFQLRKILTPATHLKMNDEFQLNHIDEVPIFFDIFHDKRAEETVNKLMNGLSDKEFDILKLIVNKLVEFNKLCKNKSLPYNSILRHFYQFKLINKLLPNCNSFFEIGPGSGFLPLISVILNKNVNYLCTDISEAYYCTQEILYNYFEVKNKNNNFLEKGKISHLPWWEYLKITKNKFKVDCVIVNHAICEMHEDAIKFLLKISTNLNNKYFFLEGRGHDEFLSFNKVKELFKIYGYKLVYEKNNVYIFENYNDFKTKNNLLDKFRNYPFLRLFTSEIEYLFEKINDKIKHQNKTIFKEDNIKIKDVNQFYDKIYSQSNIRSLSENFFKFLKIN